MDTVGWGEKYKTIQEDDVTIFRGATSCVDRSRCKGENEDMESGGCNYVCYV